MRLIKTEIAYEVALKKIELLWDAKPGTAKGDELDALVTLVEVWEDAHYPIGKLD